MAMLGVDGISADGPKLRIYRNGSTRKETLLIDQKLGANARPRFPKSENYKPPLIQAEAHQRMILRAAEEGKVVC